MDLINANGNNGLSTSTGQIGESFNQMTGTKGGIFGTIGQLFSSPLTAWDEFKNGATNRINYQTALQNYELQKENLDYNKALNEEIFNRADTAYQRQVADLRAAGLNPLMANGGAETGGSVSPTEAPQFNYQHQDKGMGNTLQEIGNLLNTAQDFQIGFDYSKEQKAKAESAQAQATVDKATAINKILDSNLSLEEKRQLIKELQEERNYNEFFGLNNKMTPMERMSAIYANQKGTGHKRYIGFNKDGTINSGEFFPEGKEYSPYINMATKIVADDWINKISGIGSGLLNLIP